MPKPSRQTLKIALKVLCAIADGLPCDPADEVELRRIGGDLHTPGLELDELACRVIQRERKLSGAAAMAPIGAAPSLSGRDLLYK